MRVGVDIDNTLNDLSEAIAKQLDVETGTSTLEYLRENFWIEGLTGWTAERVDGFFARNLDRIFAGANVKDKYMALVINGLWRRHNTLHIVTNRNTDRHPNMDEMTREWLKTHRLDQCFEGFHYIQGCKYTYCKNENLHLDVMIEDSLERSKPFLEAGVPVILFNHGYNQDFDHKNLYRVDHWWDAFNVLTNIEREVANRYESINCYA